MNKKTRLSIQLFVAVGLVVIGCGLVISGFLVPPLGVIDSSVLVAYGETCAFAGALFGVDYSYKYKMHINGKYSNESEQES